MPIPEELKNKYIFHFTHLDNLKSIVQNGLLSTNMKNEQGIKHHNVASQTIQERRSNMEVTCEPHGFVHDYVPFYLCSVNPMFLSLVNSKNIDQQFVIFFAISIKYVEKDNVVFTDASANTSIPPNFYSDSTDLEQLDWEAVSTRSWAKGEPDHLHRRMAEVLIHNSVPITDIEYIVVWNEGIKDDVKKTFKEYGVDCPIIEYSPLKRVYNFHFLKFFLPNGDRASLVTGPFWLKKKFKNIVKSIVIKRKEQSLDYNFPFENITDLLEGIETNFNTLPELQGIFELETVNDVHSENVSDHTIRVVDKLTKSKCFKEFDKENQQILKLSAYLHDIGKGPRSKWKNSKQPGKQPVYADHPADSLYMLERILVEEVKELSKIEIRLICLLVAYHDLIGEIIGKDRNIQQLFDVINDEKEFEMLDCLNSADVASFANSWSINYGFKVGNVKKQVIEKLNRK